MNPVFLFRLFHPPVLIPWKVIKDVRDKKIFFVNPEELVSGDPFIARITLKALVDDKTGRAFDTQSKWYKGFS